jgi:hypothetical protein
VNHHFNKAKESRFLYQSDEPFESGYVKVLTEKRIEPFIGLVAESVSRQMLIKGLLTPGILGGCKVLSFCLHCQEILQGEHLKCEKGHATIVCFSTAYDVWKLGRDLKFRLLSGADDGKPDPHFYATAAEFWKDVGWEKESCQWVHDWNTK